MENHQQQHSWKLLLSFKNATMIVCFLNIITLFFLLQGFFSSLTNSKLPRNQSDSVQLRYITESEEMRRALEPLELIKRVKEIGQESYLEQETIKQKAGKQTAAVDLSKRLKDSRVTNEANSLKALEEWRTRMMARARQRALEKNGTSTSQT
ncbi:transmembrane protein [Thalictrum thalictroides]|uniref:Transmembrane protein n=1 Tax=Thalictrum thalictroides TaxID=46969 RepID=A0A7J6WZM6_THATH|nr:transmembrane protein [Thalictrum thalictroides]